jgi:hypothetical protein
VRANELIWEQTGESCEPTGVWLLEQEAHWILCYCSGAVAAKSQRPIGSCENAVVIVTVDCETGDARLAVES